MNTPELGDIAPDFTLPGTTMVDGQAQKARFTLSGRRGHKVVLAFYPADNSPGCTMQLCSYDRPTRLPATLDNNRLSIC